MDSPLYSNPSYYVHMLTNISSIRLVNLAVPNTLRFKTKAVMPFVQMENIAMFLSACSNPPFNLQSHDTFLTVDLYESKDPAQVLQCIGAFSRAAHRINPSRFPNPIGGKARGMSPQRTGTPTVGGGSYGNRGRGVSNASNTSSAYNPNSRPVLTPTKTGDSNSGRWSPTKPTSPGVSSWSKKYSACRPVRLRLPEHRRGRQHRIRHRRRNILRRRIRRRRALQDNIHPRPQASRNIHRQRHLIRHRRRSNTRHLRHRR